MATLNIHVVQMGYTITKDVNPATETVAGLISRLESDNDIPAPPSAGGGVTVWKMTKSGGSGDHLGRCTPGPGFSDGEKVYLILD
ncbi:MAG: hypothetical protein ISR57_08540 [Bacteroidales bacterium]|nr:hypothetical protein [Bacteroidota bacterium]MBL6950674.1 hypothetical protein [Bacteroidales bacterium]